MKAAYSDLKAAWHLGSIREMREGRQAVPTQVQLIISDLCNQDCHFCAYRASTGFSTEQFGMLTEKGYVKNPNRMIPYEKCIEILDDCAVMGVCAIQFTGGGEPTVHPKHIGIMNHALNLGLDVGLVTNLARLQDGWRDLFPKLSWLRVSVDAGVAATYASIRGVSSSVFIRVMSHIESVAQQLNWSGSDCLFGAGYVITDENWKEIPDACKMLRAMGVSYVRLSAMFSKEFNRPYEHIEQGIRREIETAKRLETDTFKIVDLFGDRISDMEQESPDYSFCGYQQMNCYIGGNLKVYRCCTTSYTRHGEVGDLTNQRFAEWFKSREKREAYGTFDARSCSVCQFNGKNRIINYLVGSEPLHVNFV